MDIEDAIIPAPDNADNKIELSKLLPIIAFVERISQRVALNRVVQRRDQAIQDQVQLQHLVALLGAILREYRAAILANLMAQRHQKRACAAAGS